jgi:hypothetical protein
MGLFIINWEQTSMTHRYSCGTRQAPTQLSVYPWPEYLIAIQENNLSLYELSTNGPT